MEFEPLRSNDKRLVLVVLALVAFSVWFTIVNYEAAFPQASLDLKYSRDEITSLAREFLETRGLSTNGYLNITLFDPNDSARLYLERELGLEQANRMMESEAPIWRWRARWFRPPGQEEFVVSLTPDGELAGFSHVIPEAEAGTRLARDEAFALADQFLRSQTDHEHRLIEEQLQERPNRHDYVFTWERVGFRAKDATYRRTIVVQGGEVGQYSEYLHIPEQWERDYAALRSSNELYASIAGALYVALVLAAIAVVVISLRRRAIQWRPLVLISGAVGVLAVVNQWNLLPFFVDAMPTSARLSDTLILGILQGMGAGVGYFFYVILGAAPGEPLYRASQPCRLSLGAALGLRGFRTREFFRATLAGYGFAAAHLVFLVSFYLIGKRLGVWSPQDVSYSNILSTAFPWIFPLTIAVTAATTEEFWFRLFAIPLLRRYLRLTWVAVVIPAFVWGFLHANYPQQPGFIRGIEVGIIGVGAGYLMLRFGILAPLIWHYTINAFLVSTILFESGSLYSWASGILVSGAVLIPLAISLFHYRRNGGFLADPQLLNSAATPVPEEPPAAGPIEHEAGPVRPRWPVRWLLAAAAVALAAGLFLRPAEFGDFAEVRLSRARATEIASETLSSRGVDPAGWRTAVQFAPNLDTAAFEYVRRLEGREAANEAVRQYTNCAVWVVRFFRAQDPEEYRVYVNQEGAAYRVDHVLDEKAAGAKLESPAARALAESFLAGQGIPVARYRLVDGRAEERDNRVDHAFVWELEGVKVGEATVRISAEVIGDEVSGFRRFLWLPEAWLREFNRPRLRGYIIPSLAGAFGLPLLIVFVRRIGSRGDDGRRFHWKAYLWITGAVTVAALLSAANRWSSTFAGYDTAQPLENFVGQWILGRIVLTLFTALGTFLLAMAADVFLQMAIGNRRFRGASLVRAAGVTVLFWGVFQALAAAHQAIPGDRLSLSLWQLTDPDTALPGASVLIQSLLGAITLLGPVIIVSAAAFRYLRNRTGYALLAATVALVALSRATNVWQWSFGLIEGALLLGLAILLLRTCAVDLIGYAVAIFWLEVVSRSVDLIRQPEAFLRWNGILALAAGLTIGVVAVLAWRPQGADSLPADPAPEPIR